jgi:hypothetical protein
MIMRGEILLTGREKCAKPWTQVPWRIDKRMKAQKGESAKASAALRNVSRERKGSNEHMLGGVRSQSECATALS